MSGPEKWRRVWRALAPTLLDEALTALQEVLETDSPRLLQGQTCRGEPLPDGGGAFRPDVEVTWGCPLALCAVAEGRASGRRVTVAEVQDWIAHVARDVERVINEDFVIRRLLVWIDETPRAQMRAELLEEVLRELARRQLEEPEDDTA